MGSSQYAKLVKWQVDKMTRLQMEVDKMASLQDDKLVKWQVGEMAN
jgi:hypothetical protein